LLVLIADAFSKYQTTIQCCDFVAFLLGQRGKEALVVRILDVDSRLGIILDSFKFFPNANRVWWWASRHSRH